MSKAATKHSKKWLVWGLAVFFYLYEYILRVSPTVMVSEIMRAFNKQAVAVGSLSAAYLYSYALMQVPVGMLMDKYGARRLLSLASLICTLGCAFYGFAPVFSFLVIGRILLGIGSAFGFIGMVYVSSHWFERNRIATLIGIGNSLGMIGAIGGEGPLALSVLKYEWRIPMLFLGAVGLLLAIYMFFALRSDENCQIEKHDEKARAKIEVLSNFKSVASNPQSWLIGIGTFLIYSTTTAFAALWGVPFLQSAYQLKKSTASFAVSMIFVGWIVGGPIIGKISDYLKDRRIILMVCSLLGALMMSTIIYISELHMIVLYLLLLLVGVFSSAENLCYCLAIEHNERKAKGVASAFINCILFLGAAGIPIIVGSLLDSAWTGNMARGIPIYTLHNYQIALMTFPVTFVLAAIFFFFVKKSPFVPANGEEYLD